MQKYHLLVMLSLFLVSCGGGNNGSVPSTDQTAPTVITITPKTPPTGQTVPVSTIITATFSESMSKKSVEDGFIVVPNNNGTIRYNESTNTVTYSPSPESTGTALQGDTKYTVTLKNSITDNSNNPLTKKTWSFRTEDNVSPKLVSCIPKCNGISEINVSTNLTLYLFFDEAMFKDSFTNSTVIVEAVGSKFRIKGKLILTEPTKVVWSALTPSEIKPLTDYIVTITTGVQDYSPAHNPLDVEKIITFKTGKSASDMLPPIVDVSNITPVGGEKNVALNTVIRVKFVNSDGSPEIMDFTSINKFNFIVTNELNMQVAGTFSNNSLDTVIFTPSTTVGSGKPKNLNLLDTYTVTLKSTNTDPIKDKANKRLDTTNGVNGEIVVSTFYTADGILSSTPTQLGIGLGDLYGSNAVYLSTKKDGSVHAIWPKNNATATKKLIMSRTYQPIFGWDATPTNITSKIVTPAFDAITHSLQHISAIVTDSNDNHMLIWQDKIDNTNIPREYTSIIVSQWSKAANGTKTWTAPEIIHKGSITQTLDNVSPNKASVHRSANGTITVAWVELDKTLTTVDDFLVMRQLKSNDGTFKTVWSPKSRITSTMTSTRGNLNEGRASLRSDSAGNIIVLYNEILLLASIYESRVMVAKYPFPSSASSLFQLDTYSYELTSDSSGNNFVFSWTNRNITKVSDYNPNQNLAPSKLHIVSNTVTNIKGNQKGVAAFPSGDRLVVSVDANGINYSQYDPSISGWGATKTLEPVTATFFKFYHGIRNIVTVAWEANSKIYVKRFKPGFGWQPTQSITANDVQNIDITSSVEGKTTIIWESVVSDYRNLPTKSDLFAIQLE